MKKKLGIIFLIFIVIFTILGCKKDNKEKVTNDFKKGEVLFNQEAGLAVLTNFMDCLKNNNFNGAKELCKDELYVDNLHKTDDELLEYKIVYSNLLGNDMKVEVMVDRSKTNKPMADLDLMKITISRLDDETYKISKIESRIIGEVFESDKKLKVSTYGNLETKTLIDLKNIPRDMYLDNKIFEISKLAIPSKEFGVVNFSLSANKVAISTYDDSYYFVGIVNLNESIQTAAGEASGEKGQNKKDKEKKDDDKKIGDKITPLDIYKDKVVKGLNFLEQDLYLIVSFKESEKGDGIKIYDIAKGKEVDADLENIFPRDKYNVNFVQKEDYNFVLEVTGIEGAQGLRQSVTGKYLLDLKRLKVSKI